MDPRSMLRGPALEELPAQSSADPVSGLSNLRIAEMKEKNRCAKGAPRRGRRLTIPCGIERRKMLKDAREKKEAPLGRLNKALIVFCSLCLEYSSQILDGSV